MYPFLLPELFGYVIPLYDVFVMIGIICMMFYIASRFDHKDGFQRQETNRLLVLIIISLILSLGVSYVIDGIFHTIKEGEWSFGSISFLGALIGGVASFLVLYKYFFTHRPKQLRTIMNTVLTGVVLAHAFGRIGCFLAGCCYGVPTESYLGVVFGHGDAHDAFGETALWPTQLMESFFLFTLFFVLHNVKKIKTFETETYLIGYGIWRIFIELLRGDNRGVFLPLFETTYNVFPTPSQFFGFVMIVIGTVLIVKRHQQIPTQHIQKA